MELVHSIDATKLKRDKSKEAIQLALEGEWRKAVAINQDILYYFPEDVEALNRLGKAYLETGEYTQAKQSFQKVLGLSSHNRIAKRNLERLSHLSTERSICQEGKKVTPQLFLAESGKSGITTLRNVAPQEILAKVAAGDPVSLEMQNNGLAVKDQDGDVLGHIEPKLGTRLTRLIRQGNRYSAAVVSSNPRGITIIIRETSQHPTLVGVTSFPTASREEYRGYLREPALRIDIESEPDEEADEDPMAMWTEDGEEAPSTSSGRAANPSASGDEEGEEEE